MARITLDDLLADTKVRPDDPPGTAAALLWRRVAEVHEVPDDSPLAPLGVLHRVVLLLLDVVQLTDAEVAALLNTDPGTIAAAHAVARERVGLPPVAAAECPEWEMVRAVHRFGDPATVDDILEHVDACSACGGTARELGTVRRWWARRAVLASPGALGGAFTVAPAFAATAAGAALAVGAAAVWLATGGLGPDDPLAELPVPVVVEDQPVLPTDQEPATGWPAVDDATDAVEGDAGDPTPDALEDDADDGPDGTGDVTDDLTNDLTDDLTEDVTDDVGDAVDDVTEDVTDTLDDVTDGLDAPGVDDLVDDAADTVDDLVDDVTGTVEDTTGRLLQPSDGPLPGLP